MGEIELLPCPFCGHDAVETTNPDPYRGLLYRIECVNRFTSCPVNMRTHHEETAEKAKIAWNTRSPACE